MNSNEKKKPDLSTKKKNISLVDILKSDNVAMKWIEEKIGKNPLIIGTRKHQDIKRYASNQVGAFVLVTPLVSEKRWWNSFFNPSRTPIYFLPYLDSKSERPIVVAIINYNRIYIDILDIHKVIEQLELYGVSKTEIAEELNVNRMAITRLAKKSEPINTNIERRLQIQNLYLNILNKNGGVFVKK